MENQKNTRKLLPDQAAELIKTLKSRFEKNMSRHREMDWGRIQERLEADHGKLWSLREMERTGGEPDITGYDELTDEYIFCDCSTESPSGRIMPHAPSGEK